MAFLTITPTEGNGDKDIQIVASENTTRETLNQIVVLKSETLTKSITYTQSKKDIVPHFYFWTDINGDIDGTKINDSSSYIKTRITAITAFNDNTTEYIKEITDYKSGSVMHNEFYPNSKFNNIRNIKIIIDYYIGPCNEANLALTNNLKTYSDSLLKITNYETKTIDDDPIINNIKLSNSDAFGLSFILPKKYPPTALNIVFSGENDIYKGSFGIHYTFDNNEEIEVIYNINIHNSEIQ